MGSLPGMPNENPYCMRCSRHLGLSFHETNEHDEARARLDLHEAFNEAVRDLAADPDG